VASSEWGWFATYQLRSDWCIPSTEISSTCLIWPLRWADALGADMATVPPIATVAMTAAATFARTCMLPLLSEESKDPNLSAVQRLACG
jgi:hypothetical protein